MVDVRDLLSSVSLSLWESDTENTWFKDPLYPPPHLVYTANRYIFRSGAVVK